MLKPKLKNIAAALPKEARRQLINQYKQSVYKAPARRPEQEGVKEYEKGVQSTAKKAKNVAKRMVRRHSTAKQVQVFQKPLPGKRPGRKTTGKLKKAQRRKKTVQQSVRVAQKTVKAVTSMSKKVAMVVAKTATAAGKAIAAALAACGPVVIIIIAVALIAAILASSLGLFFSEETGDVNTVTVRQVVEETASDFNLQIEGIVAANPHDELDVQYHNNGTLRADNWIDVLAVFAVKTTTSNDGMDVLTMDETRVGLLNEVFWEMHSIEYDVEEIESTEPLLDAEGNDTGEIITILKGTQRAIF